ncbi:MAG TPA: ATP-binding cassette domain-containing protein [Leifsonia sp.]|nr:ATP-binding cassette domain-containing protein [Leifsonia sp.]
MTALDLRGESLRRVYTDGADQVIALDHASFHVPAGTTAAVVGPSGSGKSTLMTILAGLQRPTSGRVLLGDTDLTALSETELLAVRARTLAVVTQNADRNLLPYASADDNIRFAQRGARSRRKRQLPDPGHLLTRLGLGHLRDARTDQLSGGERQRLALAVGVASNPGILLADEPTSQLDETSRDRVIELLHHINTHFGVTILAVTHDPYFSSRLGSQLNIAEGRLGAPDTHNQRNAL